VNLLPECIFIYMETYGGKKPGAHFSLWALSILWPMQRK
jgi:hypothetical protein